MTSSPTFDEFEIEISAHCGYSSSQDEILQSIVRRQVPSHESLVSSPSPIRTPPYSDRNNIYISSFSDTPPEEHLHLDAQVLVSRSEAGKEVVDTGNYDNFFEELTSWFENQMRRNNSFNIGEKLASWAEEETNKVDEEVSVDGFVGILLEGLKWLDEQTLKKDDECGADGDFLETAKKFGMKFPEPPWSRWQDLESAFGA